MTDAGPALLAFGAGFYALPVFAAAGIPLAAPGEAGGMLTALTAGWLTMVASVKQAHAHAPALVIGLATLLAIPPLALAGHFFARRRAAAEEAKRLARLAPPLEDDGEPGTHVPQAGLDIPTPTSRTRAGDGMTWPVDAWLKVEGRTDAPVPIVREILRVGREDDNDIVLPSPTVHRYHAVVQRTEEAEIVVLDLSGDDGNGVLVNGKRVSRQRLRDGDTITIGSATLKLSARRV